MNFRSEMQNGKTYLVCDIDEIQEIDNFVLGMITHLKIDCLAQVLYTQIDEKKLLKYNLTAKISLTEFFKGMVNKRQLIGILVNLTKAFMDIEDCMIYMENVVLDFDYIYADVSSYEVSLLCLPFKVEDNPKSVQMFFKQILNSIIPDPSEDAGYFGSIFAYLNSHTVLKYDDFLKLLGKLSGDARYAEDLKAAVPLPAAGPSSVKISQNVSAGAAKPKVVPVNERPVSPVPAPGSIAKPVQSEKNVALNGMPAKPSKLNGAGNTPPSSEKKQVETDEEEISLFYLLQHYNADNKEKYIRQRDQKKENSKEKQKPSFEQQPVKREINKPQRPQSANPVVVQQPAAEVQFQYEPSLAGIRDTEHTLDMSALEPVEDKGRRAFLKRIKTGEMIEITKQHFRIGKKYNFVDYCPADIDGLSRAHANIVTENDGYYITDTNSTNHTYLNGAMIPSNQPFKLENGTRVRLVNEEFEFIIRES